MIPAQSENEIQRNAPEEFDEMVDRQAVADVSRLPVLDPVISYVQQQEMLKSILNGMEALICVCDSETFEILFLNDSIRHNFGIETDGVGKICYQLLQKQSQPCQSCPYRQLHEEPGVTLIWEHKESIKGSILRKTARLIDWPGGGKGHLEYAIDITELRQTQVELEQRERMLEIINKASFILLRQGDSSFAAAMNEGIDLIAGIASIDRLSVYRNIESPDGLAASQLFRWQKQAGGVIDIRENLVNANYADYVPRWREILAADKCISGLARLMPEADVLVQFGCMSVLAVPGINDSKFWGFILYEKLIEEDFSVYETEVLQAASFMLSNAVMRNEDAIRIREGNERVKLMLDAMPFACSLWNQNHQVIDCNEEAVELFGFENKAHHCAHFFDCIPEFQPDGRRSAEKLFERVDKAFEVGKWIFEWMHQTLDGVPIPTKITLVRVRYGDELVVAEYVHDLRTVKKMERSILKLELEVEKIYYDPLTGIYSRRYFEENIGSRIESLSIPCGKLSLMMVDIDFFKQYNDTYGHIQGDECLKMIAEILQDCTKRKADFVARYGGEEFAVVLPNTDEEGACRMAEEMLESVRSYRIPHSNSSVAKYVTVSIGVVTGRAEQAGREGQVYTRDDFLKRADELLYESKQSGRNKYSFAVL